MIHFRMIKIELFVSNISRVFIYFSLKKKSPHAKMYSLIALTKSSLAPFVRNSSISLSAPQENPPIQNRTAQLPAVLPFHTSRHDLHTPNPGSQARMPHPDQPQRDPLRRTTPTTHHHQHHPRILDIYRNDRTQASMGAYPAPRKGAVQSAV